MSNSIRSDWSQIAVVVITLLGALYTSHQEIKEVRKETYAKIDQQREENNEMRKEFNAMHKEFMMIILRDKM